MKNLLLFEEFCKSCATPDDDKYYSDKTKKKARRNKYKDPEHEKKRGAFMKNLMKGEIPRK